MEPGKTKMTVFLSETIGHLNHLVYNGYSPRQPRNDGVALSGGSGASIYKSKDVTKRALEGEKGVAPDGLFSCLNCGEVPFSS